MTDTTVEDVGTNALEATTPAENLENTPVPETVVAENVENSDPEPDPAPKEHGNRGKTPWYMERINEETNKRRQTEERLALAERERSEAKALLERLQQGDKEPTERQPRDERDIEAMVDARAAKRLFDADCGSVANAWQAEAPEDFQPRLDVLAKVGVLPLQDGSNTEFMEDVLAVDKANAHKILDFLAQNPDKALSMRQMTSRSRIAALTRMQMSETAKPAPVVVRSGVSRVPPPKPVVEAVSDGGGEMDLANDKLDAATWSKLWNKKYRATA